MKTRSISFLNVWREKGKQKFPKKQFIVLVIIWLALAIVYRYVLFPLNNNLDLELDIPQWFPVSVLYGPKINLAGLPFLLLMIIGIIFLLRQKKKLNEQFFIFLCCLLVVLGNLGQGGIDQAFIEPFISTDAQYYYDAVRVENCLEWLGDFNLIQPNLSVHSRTHPPFAVLIHNVAFALSLPGYRTMTLAVVFSIISLTSLFLFSALLKIYGLEEVKRKLLVLLLAVIPSVNIYSIVSLDGVILTTSTLFLLGVGLTIKKPIKRVLGYILMILGFISTNLLTYGGLFLLGFGLLISLLEIIDNKSIVILKGMILVLLSFALLLITQKHYFEYSHIQGFITASNIENPNGFRLFCDGINYCLTRIEGMSEIAFFLSFGILSYFIRDKIAVINKKRILIQNEQSIAVMGLIVLFFMFISGAFRTGETARACLFIYPYILLALVNYDTAALKMMVALAGVQTFLMQVSASFYW